MLDCDCTDPAERRGFSFLGCEERLVDAVRTTRRSTEEAAETVDFRLSPEYISGRRRRSGFWLGALEAGRNAG